MTTFFPAFPRPPVITAHLNTTVAACHVLRRSLLHGYFVHPTAGCHCRYAPVSLFRELRTWLGPPCCCCRCWGLHLLFLSSRCSLSALHDSIPSSRGRTGQYIDAQRRSCNINRTITPPLLDISRVSRSLIWMLPSLHLYHNTISTTRHGTT